MNNNRSGTFWQALATIVIWIMVTGGIALGGVFLAAPLGEAVLGFFFMLLAAAVISTGFVWDWGRIPGDGRRFRKRHAQDDDRLYNYAGGYDDKRKRDRLSDALRSLADDELIHLRERLARGEIEEEELARILREDRN